jgi:hypothetical protein
MATPEFRFRAKFAVVNFSAAVGLALAAKALSVPYYRWLLLGAAAGSLLLSVPLVLRWWLFRVVPAKPEDIRRKISARSRWIKHLGWATLCVVYIGILTMQYLLPSNVEALILGLGLGVTLSIATLVGPPLWQAARSRPRERKGRLEPLDSSNQIHMTRPPSTPAEV